MSVRTIFNPIAVVLDQQFSSLITFRILFCHLLVAAARIRLIHCGLGWLVCLPRLQNDLIGRVKANNDTIGKLEHKVRLLISFPLRCSVARCTLT
jgi:hypothetical protein